MLPGCGDGTAADTDTDGADASTTMVNPIPMDPDTTSTAGPAGSSETTVVPTTEPDPGNESSSTTDADDSTSTSDDASSTTTGATVETTIEITRIGRYAPEPLADIFDEGAAEIAAFDPISQSLFVTNGNTDSIDVLDLSDPTAPAFVQTLGTDDPDLSGPTSVAVADGVVAAAFPAGADVSDGQVLFFDTDGTELGGVTVGALPDMVTFGPDGTTVFVANEGEPEGYEAGQVDPEGSISIIDVSGGVADVDASDVTTADFTALTMADIDASTRVFGPGASIAQDLEPEYVAVAPDGQTAWVSLQENNALAIVDVAAGTVTDVVGLGFQDHSVVALDPSDRDEAIDLRTGPVLGMRMPDAIAAFEVGGETFIVTANEGDGREYDGFEEEDRLADIALDPVAFPDAAELQQDEAFGRLTITLANGDTDMDGDYDELYCFGSRSVSIFDAAGALVWDSGDEIEQVTAAAFPDDFNANNDENDSFESRSDNKGPEPEGVTVGTAFGTPYVFAGLERIGGFMTWDVSDPAAPVFHSYVNPRDFSGDAEAGTADDLAPEGMLFVSADDSPTDNPLLIVTNEVSGTTSIYEITEVPVEE